METGAHERFAGRSVVITGAGGGIGSALRRDEQAGDIVGTVSVPASDDAAFITGQIINVDGGAEFH